MSVAERFYTLDGDIIYAEATFAIIRDYGQTSIVVMLRDVTTKRRAEKAMKESEESCRIIAEYSMDIIKVLDPTRKSNICLSSLRKNIRISCMNSDWQRILSS